MSDLSGYPLGTNNPDVFIRNVEKEDEFVNSPARSFMDRFGNERFTIAGLESFAADQRDSFESRFAQFLASSGYVRLGDYAAGIVITEYNQIFRHEGEWWRAAATTELPYTTTGDWATEGGLFVGIGEGLLREELANPDIGATIVGRSVVSVDTYADLLLLPNRRSDLRYLVGGTSFKWDFQTDSFIPEGVVNAKIFGLSPDASPQENSDAIEFALGFCAYKASIYVEPVTHSIIRTVEIPSGTHLFSDGIENIIFKMDSSIRRGEMVMVTGYRGNHKKNIRLHDFAIDFNRERWVNDDDSSVYMEMTPDGPWYERNMFPLSQSTLVVCNTSESSIKNIKSIDGYSHCIDITAPSDGRYQSSAILYDPEPSFNIEIDNIIVSGHGDDGLTTHQSHDIKIGLVESLGASGVKTPLNANAVEIDDGSRRIQIGTVIGRGCTHALSIQGHEDSPAPYSVSVGTVVSINCVLGVFITHTGWAGPDPVFSPTGRDVSIGEILCIAPRRTEFYGSTMEARGAFGVSAYEGVSVGTIHCDDGSGDLARDIDGVFPTTPLDPELSRLVSTYSGNARGLTIGTIFINGFKDEQYGVYLAPRYGAAIVSNLISHNGPRVVFKDQTVPNRQGAVALGSYNIRGEHVGDGTSAIEHTGEIGSTVGGGVVVGYDTAVSGPNGSGSSTRYSISDSSVDTRLQDFGHIVRRGWVGNSIRSSEWITPNNLNIGSVGGRVAFYDTSGGDTDTSVGLTIMTGDAFVPGRNNQLTLGNPTNRWSQVYATNGTINTSDEREKEQIRDLSDSERRAAIDLKSKLKVFKWKDSVKEKGANARWHFGVMAQEVERVFKLHGLDAFEYGLLCYDEWDDIYKDDGALDVPAGDRYGVRYDQLMAFIISAM